jgi:glycosyltransferase involved in cell wall biosynthesis
VPPDRRLSVLLVSPESTGGIGIHVRMLAEGLLARGHSVTVCAPESTVERLGLRGRGAAVVGLPVGRLGPLPGLNPRLRALAAGHDITHAHGVRVGAQLAVAAAMPLVTTWHNAPLGSVAHRALHRALEVVSARRSALVLGASQDLVRRAHAAGATTAKLCAVAAPPGDMPARRVSHNRELHDPPRILAVGRLHPQKRFDLLIDVAPAIADELGGLDVVIVGEGPLAETLARRVKGRRAPVTFLGSRSDVDALMAQADVAVLASEWEARPLVAQEALRAGVPLVATDVGGVRDLVGDAAVLVPPDDRRALATAIRTVLTDGALRDRLSRAGPARAATWPTVDDMVDSIVVDYLEVSTRMSRDRHRT